MLRTESVIGTEAGLVPKKEILASNEMDIFQQNALALAFRGFFWGGGFSLFYLFIYFILFYSILFDNIHLSIFFLFITFGFFLRRKLS